MNILLTQDKRQRERHHILFSTVEISLILVLIAPLLLSPSFAIILSTISFCIKKIIFFMLLFLSSPNPPKNFSKIGLLMLYGIFATTLVKSYLKLSKLILSISPCCNENFLLTENFVFKNSIKSLSNSTACNLLILESNNLDVKAPLPGPISRIKSCSSRLAVCLIFSKIVSFINQC